MQCIAIIAVTQHMLKTKVLFWHAETDITLWNIAWQSIETYFSYQDFMSALSLSLENVLRC